MTALGLLLPFEPSHGAARSDAAQFVAQTNLVEVYATVTGPSGQPVTGLRPDDFVVEEDGVRQRIETFATGETSLALAVAVDRSFSIGDDDLARVKIAVRGLADELPSGDQLMVLGIGGETEVLAPLGADRTAVRAAMDRLERWGTTPLFDAVIQAIAVVQPAAGRRALILLSDGSDRYSDATASDVVSFAREHDVLVYPVSIGREPMPVWREVAVVSGGRSFHVRDARTLSASLQLIIEELRRQYLLGYAPPTGASGWRSIRVGVNRPDARVRARDGYRVPAR